MVQKVSAIYKAGTAHSSTVIPGDPGRVIVGSSGNVGYVTGTPSGVASGSFSTRLASELAPPAPPTPAAGYGCTILIGIGLLILGIYAALRASNYLGPYWAAGDVVGSTLSVVIGVGFLLVLGVLVILWGRWAETKEREEFEAVEADHQRALARWDQLYYCARCDITFMPGAPRG